MSNPVNYIRHLETVTMKMSEDTRLNTTHVSMYLALFLMWNHNRFNNPISINRSEVMKISKIGSQATYHKCMTDLHNWNYFKYEPSFNPFKGSLIHMFNFQTSLKQVVTQDVEQHEQQVAEQVLYTSLNKKKHIQTEQTLERESELKFAPGTEEKTSSVPRKQKETKKQSFTSPSFDDVLEFFKAKEHNEVDAEKFFNHFESNGWLVGGKSKMKNWHAAARNWMLNSAKFNQEKTSIRTSKTDRLHVNQDKQYDIPL